MYFLRLEKFKFNLQYSVILSFEFNLSQYMYLALIQDIVIRIGTYHIVVKEHVKNNSLLQSSQKRSDLACINLHVLL